MSLQTVTALELQRIDESIDSVIRNNTMIRVVEPVGDVAMMEDVVAVGDVADDVEMEEEEEAIVGSTPEQELRQLRLKIIRAYEKKKLASRADSKKVVRGQRICQIYHQNPMLAKNAQSRSQKNNTERKSIWERIALQITLEFHTLGPCTVADAKKLVDYYKGRCLPRSSTLRLHVSRGSSEEFPWIDTVRQTDQPDWRTEEQYVRMLETVKFQRLQFIVRCSTEFMKQSGFAKTTKSRASALNDSRSKMWSDITSVVNWKFEKWDVEPLCIDQVKKSFSNWKRRHPGEFARSASIETPQSSSSESESEDVEMENVEHLRRELAANQGELVFNKSYFLCNEAYKIINPFGYPN